MRFWIPELELAIGLWFGSYQGCERQWLRWHNVNGDLVLNPEEREQIAIQRAERLAERLRAMGINPDEL